MSLFNDASLIVTPNGYKEGKLYSIVPATGAGDLDVTRATTATRVNSSGLIESVASNIPRLDYSNGSCPSILVEPQRTNLFTYSQDFSNSDWTKLNIETVTTGITDPANGTTGVRLVPSVGFNGIVTRIITTTIGTPYTVTIWIKGTANGTINFNHGGISLAPQNNISYTTQWQKFQYNFTADSISTEILLGGFFSWSAGQNVDFTFAQLEAGSYATSYIPTTSASVTRNADVISKTGISSLIGQSEGTLFIDFNKTHSYSSDAEILIMTYANATPLTNRVNVFFVGNSLEFFATDGPNGLYSGSITSISNGKHKLALTYGASGYKVYLDGVSVFTDSATWSPNTDSFRIGSLATGINFYSDTINLTAVWKTALTNTQLAQLTTI